MENTLIRGVWLSTIFSMYQGCKLRLLPMYRGKCFYTQLISASEKMLVLSGWYEDESENVDLDWKNIKSVKLILRDLSSITEKEMVEFSNVFRNRNEQKVLNITVSGVYVTCLVYSFNSSEFDTYMVQCTLEEMLWLASRGLDVGIVPEEYKIMEN